jgi:hypothetical protein
VVKTVAQEAAAYFESFLRDGYVVIVYQVPQVNNKTRVVAQFQSLLSAEGILPDTLVTIRFQTSDRSKMEVTEVIFDPYRYEWTSAKHFETEFKGLKQGLVAQGYFPVTADSFTSVGGVNARTYFLRKVDQK